MLPQNVLPGQPLYPIKRLGEEMTLRLPQSSEDRDARVSEYEERRRDEIHLLLGHQLEAQVAFDGEVEALGPTKIVVSDFSMTVTDDTQIQGPLAVGARAVIVELGAGRAVPTVRYQCESAARLLGAPLIRINPREPEGPPGTLSFAEGALAALRRLDERIG